MSAHFEIVTTDAEQPHHVRVIADNGEPILTSENLEHRADAERVVLILAQMFGAVTPRISHPTDGQSYVFGARHSVPIEYVDERSQQTEIVTPPVVVEAKPAAPVKPRRQRTRGGKAPRP